jgi:ankyrin repeat protein
MMWRIILGLWLGFAAFAHAQDEQLPTAEEESLTPETVDASMDAAPKVTDTDPLITAITANDADAVRKAIADGANVNRNTKDNSYPIIVASVHSTADIMKILTAHGVNVSVTDGQGRNAMHYAAMQGDLEKTKLMYAMRAPVNAVDANGITPLFYAYINNNLEIADFLTGEPKANVNQIDAKGSMLAVQVLAQQDNPAVITHMLDKGLNLFRRDAAGRNLVDVAEKMGKESVANTLQSAYDQRLKQYLEEQKKQQESSQK